MTTATERMRILDELLAKQGVGQVAANPQIQASLVAPSMRNGPDQSTKALDDAWAAYQASGDAARSAYLPTIGQAYAANNWNTVARKGMLEEWAKYIDEFGKNKGGSGGGGSSGGGGGGSAPATSAPAQQEDPYAVLKGLFGGDGYTSAPRLSLPGGGTYTLPKVPTPTNPHNTTTVTPGGTFMRLVDEFNAKPKPAKPPQRSYLGVARK